MAVKRTAFFGALLSSVFFYAWQMKSVHGLLPGLHLTGLVLSFFFLCSPLSSLILSIDQFLSGIKLPGEGFCERTLLILNLFLVVLSFFTLKQLPSIFNSSGITFLFYQLMQSDAIYQFLVLSQGSFLVHYLIIKNTSDYVRLWLSILLTLIVCLLFYAMIPVIQEVVVIGINSRASNF